MQLDLFKSSSHANETLLGPVFAPEVVGFSGSRRRKAAAPKKSADRSIAPIARYEDLQPIARGYADEVIESYGCSGDAAAFRRTKRKQFTEEALKGIASDCQLFMKKIRRLHTDGIDGLLELISEYDLGRSFYLSRQGTGCGFEEDELGPIGEELAHRSFQFGFSEIAIDDEGNISIS